MSIASPEVRKKTLDAYFSKKGTQQQLADIFGIHVCTLRNWIRDYRTEQRLCPRPRGYRAQTFSEEEKEQIHAPVVKKPDITLEEIKHILGKTCSLMAVQRELVRQGFRFKKTLKASEQDRDDIARKRKDWAQFQKTISWKQFIFIDESSAKTNMTRLYGRSLGGSRCHEKAFNGHWKNMTMLSSIHSDGKTDCIVFECAVNKDIFNEYILKILCPSLKFGDIVVMDNLSAHKSADVKKYIEFCGAVLLYLPPYSPDFNPIENMWSRIKQLLRGIESRTWSALEKASPGHLIK